MNSFEKIQSLLIKTNNPIEIYKILNKISNPQMLTDGDGNSLLHWAVIKGNYILTKIVINENFDIDKKNNFGYCPLELAIYHKQKKIFNLLISHNAKLFERNGFTALHSVSASGDIYLFKKVVSFYKNLNIKDNSGMTPLHWATQENNYKIVVQLIKDGAMINIKDKEGFTPLYISVTEGNNKIFDLLISHKANYELKYNSNTLLHIASAWNRITIAKKLILMGININACNKKGNTALHYACLYRYKYLISILIKNNADKNITNDKGLKPFEIISESEL